MNAIDIKNLTKTYSDGTEALKGIDFTVQEGDFCALLGANGAGKTTIISIISGLSIKSFGEVKIFDKNIDHDHACVKEMIGVVPQEMNFNIFEKVRDIIVTEAGYFGISRKVAIEESEQVLKSLDLWDKRNTVSRNLSGGMKRRLMIARALITKPRLLILDEPTAGVDVELRHAMWDSLMDLNKGGTTVLLTTHYLEEVERLCQNAGIIKNGEIVKFDSVRNLLHLVENEVYEVHVDCVQALETLKNFVIEQIDDHTLEVKIEKKEQLSQFIQSIARAGMELRDLRPKGNRIEQLYFNILKS